MHLSRSSTSSCRYFLALVPTWGVMTIEMDEFDPSAAYHRSQLAIYNDSADEKGGVFRD